MANGNPVGPEDQQKTHNKQAKKTYTKPAFRLERVFETQALSCGKTPGHSGICNRIQKTS